MAYSIKERAIRKANRFGAARSANLAVGEYPPGKKIRSNFACFFALRLPNTFLWVLESLRQIIFSGLFQIYRIKRNGRAADCGKCGHLPLGAGDEAQGESSGSVHTASEIRTFHG